MPSLRLGVFLSAFFSVALYALDPSFSDADFRSILKLLNGTEVFAEAPEKIERRGDYLICSGDSPAARANNAAVDMMENGRFAEASAFLEEALTHSPLFVPFRYNLGIAYYFQRNFPRSHLNFDKAVQMFPEYYLIYIQKGIVYELSYEEDNALVWYKKAARLNPLRAEPLVVIGDLYFGRKQYTMSERYYQQALKIEPRNPNAILGMAKIQYSRENMYLCYMTLKQIPVETASFDKSYYFFYAEAAYRLKRYRESYDAYQNLLKFRNDRFFISISISLIEHKAELAKRFAESMEEIGQ